MAEGQIPHRPELAVGAVAVVNDHLLLARRATEPGRGRWSLPGGRVEGGELVAAAVVREVAEETGLAVVCGELLGWTELIGEDHHFVVMDFVVTVIDDRAMAAASDADDVEWVHVNDVAARSLVDGLATFLHTHGVIPTIA